MAVAEKVKEEEEKKAPHQDEQHRGGVAGDKAPRITQGAGGRSRAKAEKQQRPQEDGLEPLNLGAVRQQHPQKLPLGQGAHQEDHQRQPEAASFEERQQQQRQSDQGSKPTAAVHENTVFRFRFSIIDFAPEICY